MVASGVGASKPIYKQLYVQVLAAVVLGALLGWLAPELARNEWFKALGDGFVKLIKMVIAPIIFCTVVSGISHIQDARKVGRVGVKALIYFEVMTTVALIVGITLAFLIGPGRGMNVDPSTCAVTRRRFSSGCKAHPANAPAGSNRGRHGGDEMSEAPG